MMRDRKFFRLAPGMLPLLWLLSSIASGSAPIGCSNDTAVRETAPKDAGQMVPADSGADGAADCFTNPKIHEEIINACTDAVKVDKNPNLPLRFPDGGLPPLP